MDRKWQQIVGWLHCTLLAAVPWVATWRPEWTPALVVVVCAAWPGVDRGRVVEPWGSMAAAAATTVYLGVQGGWSVLGGWLVLAVVVAGAGTAWRRLWPRRLDPAALVGGAGWAAALALQPDLLDAERGGWLAPAVLLFLARRVSRTQRWAGSAPGNRLLPPSREVRGTLSLRGVVVLDSDGVPRSVPIDLELRAGDSLAIVCDSHLDGEALAMSIAGRGSQQVGEVVVDGVPMTAADRLVAVVAPGEELVAASLEENLGVLCEEAPDETALAAMREACSLDEVIESLDGRDLTVTGEPLTAMHRLQVLAARVIPSHYRLLVVVDPNRWLDAARGERWRAAVVRASVGRTAVWLTADGELAARADQAFDLRRGALRPRPENDGGTDG